jgi:hypothetical protein
MKFEFNPRRRQSFSGEIKTFDERKLEKTSFKSEKQSECAVIDRKQI